MPSSWAGHQEPSSGQKSCSHRPEARLLTSAACSRRLPSAFLRAGLPCPGLARLGAGCLAASVAWAAGWCCTEPCRTAGLSAALRLCSPSACSSASGPGSERYRVEQGCGARLGARCGYSGGGGCACCYSKSRMHGCTLQYLMVSKPVCRADRVGRGPVAGCSLLAQLRAVLPLLRGQAGACRRLLMCTAGPRSRHGLSRSGGQIQQPA